ncbi:MAG TPA: molybdate ABC transporter substrate-binding protein [Candidatus Acidoferrum sp.]|jgi:molybdate transport system substrate-binding protein
MTRQKLISPASLLAAALFLLTFFIPRAVLAQEVRIAAAADLKFAMTDLAAQYEKQSHQKIDVTYGSSGNFLAQIQNGAPFDIFFSADMDYPKQLQASGLAEPGTLYPYAVGQIVIWTPPNSSLDVRSQGWKALLDPQIQKIAIANPAHAPYGRAAVAALRKAGIYDQVAAKLVYGENISQAAQFVQSGNAQAGIIAMSLAVSPAMSPGNRWEIPAGTHPPIEQAAIVLKTAKNKSAALAFMDFIKSSSARATLIKYGFTFTESQPPK